MYDATLVWTRGGAWLVAAMIGIAPLHAAAWGDDGHAVVARIAEGFLVPDVRQRVLDMLAADDDDLTSHDLGGEATWADKLRDSNRGGAQLKTRQWHFVDIELDGPDIDSACFQHPSLPEGAVAADGVADDCVVDKVEQFAAELAAPQTDAAERTKALKFLLHFVGDLHQPLHAGDDHDRGGNDKRVVSKGFKAGNLHHFWDTEFVRRLGDSPESIATDIAATITDTQRAAWEAGTASDWAMESFEVCSEVAYGGLDAKTPRGSFRLSSDYVANAVDAVRTQLARAGVRLALILNRALAPR